MIDLPKSNIKSSIGIVIDGMRVSSTLMGDYAFAAVGIPIVFSTPGGDIFHKFSGSAGAAGTFTWGAVSTAALSEGKWENEKEKDDNFHKGKDMIIWKRLRLINWR